MEKRSHTSRRNNLNAIQIWEPKPSASVDRLINVQTGNGCLLSEGSSFRTKICGYLGRMPAIGPGECLTRKDSEDGHHEKLTSTSAD